MAALVDRLPPALRGLLRQKRFATLAVAALGISIALNTTMYSVMDAMLFPRFAIREPDRLYHVQYIGDAKRRVPWTVKLETLKGFSFYEDIAVRYPSFFAAQSVAERGPVSRNARVSIVSPNYLTLLGVTPTSGRVFGPGDAGSTAQPVVISEAFWRLFYPERESFDSASFTLDGVPRTVIGILPYNADIPGDRTEVWAMPADFAADQESMFAFNVVRLKPGVTTSDAYRELGVAAEKLGSMAGDGPNSSRFKLVPAVSGPANIGNGYIAIVQSVFLVLLVACLNLANLQLARGLNRTRELATRAAVGASRRNLLSLLVGESAWIAGIGLVIGTLLTFWAIHVIRTEMPPMIGAYEFHPQVSWRLFAVSAVAGVFALALVGLIPAIRVSRVDPNELLKSGAGTGSTRKSRWHAGVLVMAQVGLALVLMVTAVRLIQASAALRFLDINPALERVVHGWVGTVPTGPNDTRSLRDASTMLIERGLRLDGVVAAATSRTASADHFVISIAQASQKAKEVPTGMWNYRIVSPSFFDVFGTKVLKGRNFLPGETSHSVIVDQRTARYLWPGADPMGQQIKFGSDTRHDEGWLTVVGVSDDIDLWASFRKKSLDERSAASLGSVFVLNSVDDVPLNRGRTGQGMIRRTGIDVYVRGTEKIERLPLAMQRGLGDKSSGFAVGYTDRLYSQLMLDQAKAAQDFSAALFGTFALLALALSTLGVYAVVSHIVTQRTREIGVRVALGATGAHVRQSVLQHGNVLSLGGIALGMLASAIMTGAFSRINAIMGFIEWWVFGAAAAVLVTTTLLASFVPALRAMRINPVEALRSE